MSAYDALLKQVANLKQENYQLRNELKDNSSHLTKLENEASHMKNVLPPVKLEMDDDADEVYDDYDEEGIHVFVQGGGGESRDINHNDEDVSPNDSGPIKQAFNYNTEARNEKQNDTAVREKSRSPPNTTASSEIPGKTPNLSDSDFYNRMRELNNERNLLLTDIEEEDKHRKWYCEQLEVIAQKIQSIHVGEKYNRQSDMARRQLEFEAKRIQNSFEQSMGDNDQIVQRQEVRLRKIQEIETEMIELQQQHRQQSERNKVSQQENEIQERKGDTATQKEEAESVDSSDSAASAVSIATQTATGQNDVPNMSIAEDPNASVNLSSLYHGAWPMTPPKKDLEFRQEGGSGQNSSQAQDLASIMSFNSINTGNNSQGPAPSQPAPVTLHQPPPMVPQQDPALVGQHPQQLGTKVEMVYSLLSMLGTHDKDDMSRTLLAMSSSQDSCIAMRQSGCMPLLIQLLHGSDKDSGLLGNTRGSKSARARAAAALHNIVHSHPDDKRGRREARVLRLLEQIRAHCDQLRESTSDEEEEGKNSKAGIRTQDMDHHPGPAVAALMKLSFDEEHRHAICSLGGVQAIAELIEVDSEINGNTSEQYNVTMRRYGCMALTNLTFGDGTNKALLCSMKGFMEALVYQLQPSCEDLCQVAASVLRNLSWKADLASKKTLREVGAGTTLMKAAMAVKKEATLKSILSALWNLSAHGSENKADICAVDGALEFLVSTLTYKSPSKTMAVVENGGGILRNISSHITVREDYRQILRRHGCLQILLKQLRSTSLTIVSNACGTLWNLSARCLEDQKALWDMGAVGMLRNLVNSKHQMISMGSSAALKNLLAACPSIKDMKMDQKSHLNRPTLHVRKQRALEAEIDQSLSETCENLESPRDSPTENVRTEKDQTRFVFPANVNVISNDVEPRRPLARGPVIPRSTSGENTPVTENKLRSPHRVARSGSQDSVGSTHSDISHDRNRFHYAMKNAKNFNDRHGGSLDRKQGTALQKSNSDGSCERTSQGNSNRILQVMQEVAQHAGIDSNISKGHPSDNSASQAAVSSMARKDQNFSLPHTLLYRSFTNPSIPQHVPHLLNGAYSSPGYGLPPVGGINHQEDDEQPIDYSMKYESVQNKGPPAQQGRNNLPPPPPLMPKYGNFVGPNNPQIYPVMHHSFPGQPMNQNMFGLRHHLPMMHQMVPVVPQFNAYAETDLDNDQPTDFSVRYAERDENYSDQPVSYSMQYQDSDPNCTDCKLEAAIRTSDQYVSGINEDQTMTFYTEGTPLYNLSTATSLTDLSNRVHEKDDSKEKEMKNQMQEEDEEYGDFCDIDKRSGSGSKLTELEKQSKTDSQSTDQQTGTTVIQGVSRREQIDLSSSISQQEKENSPELSFHIPADDDHSEDQIKTYCEEGTPICFSRVSSLSSLHSSEAQDRQENKLKQTSLQSIEETERGKTPPRPALKNSPGIMSAPKYTPNTGRQKLLSDSDVQSDDISEKEHKTVTFDDNHQVEETPLMFSRCSSLSSLGSFDAFSVHSDVVSEYSRRASEVVSPSELPDSPSETMPPSPKHSKSPETIFADKINSVKKAKRPEAKSGEPVVLKDFISANMNEVNSFKPVAKKKIIPEPNLNTIETMSTMSKEAPVIYADEGTPPKLSDTLSVLSALTFDDQSVCKSNENESQNSNLPVTSENLSTPRNASEGRQQSETVDDQSILNQSDDKENSSMSEVSEGEEDILAQCISSAMPISARKMRRSSSDNTIKKKAAVTKMDIQKNKPCVKQQNGQVPNKPKSARRLSDITKGQVHEGSEDSIKSFASEDIPGSSEMYERNKMTKPTKGMIRSGSAPVDIQSDSVKTFASEEIPKFVNRSETVRHQQKPPISEKPKSQPQNTSQIMGRGYHYDNNQVINQRVAEKARHLSKLHIMIRDDLEGGDSYGDTVKSYATEDTPMTQSAAASPGISKNHMEHMDSSKCMEYVSKIDVQVNDDCIKSYAIEGTPYNGSIPTSPKHDKNQNLNYKFKYVGGNMPPVEVEDTIQAYATEDTPLNFSRATSLSDLSIKTSDEPAENKLPQNLNSVSEPEPIPDESLDQHSDNSSLLDESDELLSELIQSAMPKGKVSRRLDMDRAAEGSETTDTFKFANPPFQKNNNFEFKPQRTSSHITAHNPISQIEMPKVYAVEGTPLNFSNATSLSDLTIDSHDAPQANKMNKPRETISSTDQSSTSHAATFGTSTDDSVFIHVESSDSLRTYMVEGTPQTFSRNDSLSSISIMDDDSKDLEKLKKLCETSQSSKAQSSNEVSQSHWSTHEDEILQREVEGQSSDETKSSSVKGTEEKLLKPSDYSHGSSLSSIPSQEHQELLEQEGIAKKDKISSQNGGLSHKDSLSSLSSDSGDDDPETDEALLDECISSALPKSRSENKSRLSQSSTSISKDIMSSSFSGRGGSTHSLTYRDSKVTETSRTYEQKQKSRMSRSCSSMEDFGDLNQSFQQKGHESRIATWKKEHVDNRPEEFQFVKPSTTVKHGAWRRSRSQDSDGFLKRQKNHSNMELAKSYNNSSRDLSENPWVLQSSVENILPASVPIDDNRVFEEIAKFTQSRLVEGEINPQYTYKNSGGSVEKIDSEKADHAKPGDRSFSNKIKKETENQENQYFGGAYYDNYGFDENAGSDHTDSADITVVNTESANITMTNDNSGGFDVTFYEPEYEEGAFESPNRSFEEEISPEDERQLEANASLIVSEIQNNKMTGSSVDEDMFIENETLSLVSGGYTSDTASEVSLTWSAKSEQLSEFSETTTVSNDDSSISTGAKIVKPSNTRQVNQEVQNQKAIRGRRKPLYSPRSAPNVQKAPVAKIDTNLKKPVNTTNRSNSTSKLTQGNVNKKTSSTRTTSHPQACSTPTRSPPKPKMTTKTSPPQQQNKSTTNRSPNSKTSPPSRLPTSTAGRKGGNSVEKPKPPIKQRTFIKDSPSANVPVIDVNDSFEFDENGNDTSNNLDNSKTLTGNQTKKSTDANRHSNEINTESWSKALESYNFVPENSAENSKKEQNFGQKNLKSGSTGVKSSTKGGQNMANNHVSSTGNMSNKGKAGVNTPGKQQNKINKSNNLSNLKKTYSGTSLTKSGSGASLNKSGSGASLNKSGSGASLNKTGSGTIFNKSGVNGLNKAGSNPNLKKVNSKGDLKKSNSNASLKSSSRPSTPVGRKNSNPIQVSKKSDNQPNKTSPQSSNTASKVTPSDSKKSLTGNTGKKQVNSKIAGLWRKEDNESPTKNNVSKLPVSTNNSPRGQQNKGGKSQQQKGNINSSFQKNSSFTIMRTESPHDGISRSSTYDKLDSTNDSSRLPCLDDIEKDAEKDMQVPVEKTSIAGASSIEKKVTSFDSDLNKSVMEEKMSLTSPEEFDLKSLEKRIDTSTWKKKKPKNEMLCLPNADETAKSLEAVRAVLNASILNESSMINSSVNDSLFTESFTDRSVSGTSWRHYREDSYSSCAPSDDEESIWIRRDADTSRSEPQLSKFSVKEKKQKRKSKGEGHSFLPIKAVKQIFRRKSTSNTSLTSSRDSNLDKSDAEDEKSTLKRKIFSKKKSDKDKKALEKASRNGSVSSLESSKTSPQSALVPPFNYTPSNTSISKPQSPSTEISESRDQDSVFVKPLPVKPLTTVHATKTEMLLARRRQSYLNSLKSDETSEEDKKRQGCMVTTV